MTIVEDARGITGGVDPPADTHVASALDPLGGLLGVQEFPATAAGYAGLLSWPGGVPGTADGSFRGQADRTGSAGGCPKRDPADGPVSRQPSGVRPDSRSGRVPARTLRP